MLGFHPQQHQHLLAANQITEAIPSPGGGGVAGDTGGGGQDATGNYLRKRYREDLFKEEGSTGQGGGDGTDSNSPTNKQFKGDGGSNAAQDVAAGPSSTLLRHPNMMPAAAMWAVATAPSSGAAGNTFWMLPVTAGGAGGNSQTLASAVAATSGAVPSEQPPPMWPFPSAAGNTLQAPLHFMPRFNIPGNLEFQGGRASPLQLGSMLMQQQQQPQPSQLLGLGMSESNLGMLAALNAYSRGGLNMNSDQQNHPMDRHHHHHHHQQPHHQPQTTDSGEDGPNNSQ